MIPIDPKIRLRIIAWDYRRLRREGLDSATAWRVARNPWFPSHVVTYDHRQWGKGARSDRRYLFQRYRGECGSPDVRHNGRERRLHVHPDYWRAGE